MSSYLSNVSNVYSAINNLDKILLCHSFLLKHIFSQKYYSFFNSLKLLLFFHNIDGMDLCYPTKTRALHRIKFFSCLFLVNVFLADKKDA